MRFAIVIYKDACSGCGVTVPDLPGCFSAGDTLDEAIESAREAIACHIEGLLMDGEPVPPRLSLKAHEANDDYRGSVWAIVTVDISKLSSKSRRINITLPERVLAIADQAAVRETTVSFRFAGSCSAQLRPAAVGGLTARNPHRLTRTESFLSSRFRAVGTSARDDE